MYLRRARNEEAQGSGAAHRRGGRRGAPVREENEVLDEGETQQVQVRGEEYVEVHGRAPGREALEEAQQLAARRPDRHLGDALLDPERQVLDDAEHVVQLVGRNLLERRELQPVVLDERHAVLVHAEEEVLRAPLQEHPPHDVANVLGGPAPRKMLDLDDPQKHDLELARHERAEEHGVELLQLRRERRAGVLFLGLEES
jgi:hypothetical protein